MRVVVCSVEVSHRHDGKHQRRVTYRDRAGSSYVIDDVIAGFSSRDDEGDDG